MALERLRTPSLSGSETDTTEQSAAEEANADEAEETDEESGGSRFGKLKATLGVALAAVIAIVTLRRLRSGGGDE